MFPRTAHHARSLFQPLEARLLLSTTADSGDFAPASFIGRPAVLTVIASTGTLPPAGTAEFLISSTRATCYLLALSGSLSDAYCNFVYTKDSPTTATFSLTDLKTHAASTQTFTFSSPTEGTFLHSTPAGTQSGTFTLTALPAGVPPTKPEILDLQFTASATHGKATAAPTTELMLGYGGYYIINAPAMPPHTAASFFGRSYSYRITTPATAFIGGNLSYDLAFSSSTQGTYFCVNTATHSWQFGSFDTQVFPVGAIDSITPTSLTGWAGDANTPTATLRVRLRLGSRTFSTTANLPRSGLAPPFETSNHGFTFSLPHLAPGRYKINIEAADPFNNHNVTIASTTLVVPKFSATVGPTAKTLFRPIECLQQPILLQSPPI